MGLVLLMTFSRALGPMDLVGLWPGGAFVGAACTGEEGNRGMSKECSDESAGAERGISTVRSSEGRRGRSRFEFARGRCSAAT